MRKVAAFVLFSPLIDESLATQRYHEVRQLIHSWRDQKGQLLSTDSGTNLMLLDGRVAEYEEGEYKATVGVVADYRLTEPSNAALVRTQISAALLHDQALVYVEIQAAGDAYQLGPMNIDIRCPHIVRAIVQAFDDWQVGESPVSARPFHFEGTDSARQLETILRHEKRNLPVIAVSAFEGSYLTETFPTDLANDLVGVALVASVAADTSWEMTRLRGKEWSCFNGAIRIYWPQLNFATDNPYRHPFWTRLSLLAHDPAPEDAAGRFRRQMRRQLFGLSAFAVPEPPQLSLIRIAHARATFDQEQAKLRAAEDWIGLANHYAKDNEDLSSVVEKQRQQISDLETQVANLQIALRWRPDQPVDVAPEATLPPATVKEAVAAARDLYAEQLLFGSDVAKGVDQLSPDAGPPDKVLKYFERLSEMVIERRQGSLGGNMIEWLVNHGISASGESKTVRSSGDEQRKRTWHDGTKRRAFELHLKPNDGAPPDRCVRIYFDYDEHRRIALVGWVGRHP